VTKVKKYDVERAQVEEVFGLTGGELSDEPWTHTEGDEPWAPPVKFEYWYDDVPSYAEDDHTDWSHSRYRTVVTCTLYSGAPLVLRDDEGTWRFVKAYTSSGETECPCRQGGDPYPDMPDDGTGSCALCGVKLKNEETGEKTPAAKHEHIYLGDGWVEAVYKLDEVG